MNKVQSCINSMNLDCLYLKNKQTCVWSHLLTLSTSRSRESNSTRQTTDAIFAGGTISSLGTAITLKRGKGQ